MSKRNKPHFRLLALGAVATLATGALTAVPATAADHVTVTVFDTPEVRYANVRSSADTSSDENVIDRINAGTSVTLICWENGSSVPSPFAGQPASTIWYKIAGYPNAWVSDAYLHTGSDTPVVSQCSESNNTAPQQNVTVTIPSSSDVTAVEGRIGPGTAYRIVKRYPVGSQVTLTCWTRGYSAVSGIIKWYRTTDSNWVPDTLLPTKGGAPVVSKCTEVDDGNPLKGVVLTNPTGRPSTWPLVFPVRFDSDGERDNGNSRRNVPMALYNHYYRTDPYPGVDASIDWGFFSEQPDFRKFAFTIPVGKYAQYESYHYMDLNMILALGEFTVFRTEEKCFLVYDYYDFGEATTYFFQYADARFGKATEFNVYSEGCLP
jgi:hypothetical protein